MVSTTTTIEHIFFEMSINKNLRIQISVPPKIDRDNSSPEKVTSTEGQDAELTCHFSGEPKPDVTWFRGYPNAQGLLTATEKVVQRFYNVVFCH